MPHCTRATVLQGSLLGCRRGSEGRAGTYLRVRVSDGVIHQHHDQDGDGDPEVSDDPPSLQNRHLCWQREQGGSLYPPCGKVKPQMGPGPTANPSTAEERDKGTQPWTMGLHIPLPI